MTIISNIYQVVENFSQINFVVYDSKTAITSIKSDFDIVNNTFLAHVYIDHAFKQFEEFVVNGQLQAFVV